MIPVNEPLLAGRELEYVTECVRTGWISSAGRFINEFEKQWAAYCGRKFGVAVSNGTVALQAAVAALDLQPGDEVIMPTFTIISCALAVVYAGGVPVLVDSEPRTWTMDVSQIAGKIMPRTKAIMPVHIYGHPVDMDPIESLAQKHGLAIIEDAAEAHGAEYLKGRDQRSAVSGQRSEVWKRCGSFGAMSCFSFYANKLITTGEGGMIVTDDDRLAERCCSLLNLCFQPQRRFYHEELGFNFRMTNMQAALGVAQLERMNEIVKKKRWMGQEYTRRLQGVPGLQLPVEESWARSVYWMYSIVLSEESGMNAESFAKQLAKRGVQTRPFFLGMHEQPVFHKRGLFQKESYPVAECIARQGLYLPSGLALTEQQLEQTVQGRERGSGSMSQVFGNAYADAYDTLYRDKDYDSECRLIHQLFQKYGSPPVRTVLDLGCGTGNHALRLSAMSYKVVGVDRSEDMLRQAQAKAQFQTGLHFHRSAIHELDLGEQFDAALMMFAVLGYHSENEDVLGALRAARRHLRVGGLLLFDVWYGPAVLTQRPGDRVRAIELPEGTLLRTTSAELDAARQICSVHFRVWQLKDSHVAAQTDETHQMRFFFPQELRLFLDVTGFRLLRLGAFPDFDHDPDETTWNIMVVALAV